MNELPTRETRVGNQKSNYVV